MGCISYLDSWITSIAGYKINESLPLSVDLIYYLAEQSKQSQILATRISANGLMVTGSSSAHGHYHVKFSSSATNSHLMLEVDPEQVWDAVALLQPFLKFDQRLTDSDDKQNFVAVKYHVDDHFSIQTSFAKANLLPNHEIDFGDESKKFHRQFAKTFPQLPGTKMYPVCKFALSNLLGSISYAQEPFHLPHFCRYFYGTSYVLKEKDLDKVIEETEPFELFTDIPSRATFPRGFLWYHTFVHSALTI